VFRFSDITRELFIIRFAHAVSHVSHTCNFSAVTLFQIPHTWTVLDITNNPFFIYITTVCIASNFMSKQVIGNHKCSLSQIPRMCGFSYIYRTCLFCNISRMESPQLSHMFNFLVSRVCAVCCVLSKMSKHFNTKFHGNVKWCRTKVLHILGPGPNETELSVSQSGTSTSGELTLVQTRLAPGLVLEPSRKRLTAGSFFLFK